jgi:hypothetical protein
MSRKRTIPDQTGRIYENLTVIEETERGKYGEIRCLCKCICGNEKTIAANSLIKGFTRSCGCILDLSIRMARGWNYEDLTGRRFGRLLCVEKVFLNPAKRGCYWRCLCDCGKEKEIVSHRLRHGKTKSCGCLAIEMFKKRAIHGADSWKIHKERKNHFLGR